MFKQAIELAREHIIVSLLGALALGATGGVGVLWNLYEARTNRIEEMKVAEFNELTTENKKFLELMSTFTEQIALSGTVDQDKKKEISASLVRLYNSFGAFSVNLSPEREQPVRRIQTSINEVKKRVQLVNGKKDLDPLSVALVRLFQDMKEVRPIIEEAVGKPTASTI
ncbi:hypothetical protein AA309_20330 [Microvirga vignae]|uniref:Chemotaxis methyl-accepting receptor HlyB-like 4HB MCP domain-containing protein n=1 Tax=Microvirga vignae TaxID=1225564 RepID=A0A0H1R9B6_9HYPH|nr:hypothetical protein [Microvirga vignae]KLK91441.1 hypothetical protein AA309_20330 [Microvirga vignae]